MAKCSKKRVRSSNKNSTKVNILMMTAWLSVTGAMSPNSVASKSENPIAIGTIVKTMGVQSNIFSRRFTINIL